MLFTPCTYSPMRQELFFRRLRLSHEKRLLASLCPSLCPSVSACTGVLISPEPDLLPDVFCLMVRIFRLMLVLLMLVSGAWGVVVVKALRY